MKGKTINKEKTRVKLTLSTDCYDSLEIQTNNLIKFKLIN